MSFYTNVCIHRNKLYHIGYNDEGKFIYEEDFQPHLGFVSNNNPTHKSIHDKPIEIKTFENIKGFNDYKKAYGDVIDLYDDISPITQFIVEKYPNDIKFDNKKIKIFFYDIETPAPTFSDAEAVESEIKSITIKDYHKNIFYVLSTDEFDTNLKHINITGKIKHKKCENEEDLLNTFVKLIVKFQPDILSGWNSDSFDDPYIINRIKKILGDDTAKMLSPIMGDVKSNAFMNKEGRKEFRNTIRGLSLIDYLEVYKKYSYGNRERYSLGFIAEYELGEDKVNYEEFENIWDFYQKDKQKFIEYNIYDVELISLLNDKLKYIDIMITMAYMTKSNFEDVFYPTCIWDNHIYSYLHEDNICIPPNKKHEKTDYTGAYVVPPQIGVFKTIVSYDIDSLYPHAIICANIGSETLLDEPRESVDLSRIDSRFFTGIPVGDYRLAGNGLKFSKTKIGFASRLMSSIYAKRKEEKKLSQQYERDYQKTKDVNLFNLHTEFYNKEQAKKIHINSFYGAYACSSFRYFDVKLAEAVTLTGQLASQFVMKNIREHFGRDVIVAGDTDSVYLCLDKEFPEYDVEKVDVFCKEKLDKLIADSFSTVCEMYNYENKFSMKRECICRSGLWTAKKRYALLVDDKEGTRYKKPKLKVVGIEIVRSSTPKAIKPYLEQTIHNILSGVNLHEYVAEVKKDFFSMTPEQISFPRGANNLTKYDDGRGGFKSGCPIQVRGVITFNRYLEANRERLNDFNTIGEGEKIKFTYLKTPNPFMNQNVLAFIRRFPLEENYKYVDYNTMFNKSYMDVITSITNRIGVKINENEETLDDLF